MKTRDGVKQGPKAIKEPERSNQGGRRRRRRVSGRKEGSPLRNSSERTRQLRTEKPPLGFTA